MRKTNVAIIRERHVTSNMEDILPELHNARVFSKLDLREGYHQIELHENSRQEHEGLFQYKRLFYGVTSAFEPFQKRISNRRMSWC